MLTITLSHCSNPDIAGGYWEGRPDIARCLKVEVSSLADASATLKTWRDGNALGGGNMARNCGDVRKAGKLIARVSYNGRVWGLDGLEITGDKLNS